MKWLLIIPGVLVGLFVLLTAPVVISIPFVLLYGWVPAARRLASDSPFSALELTVFGVGCLLLLTGVHWFARRFVQWRFRWSIALTGTMALVLLSIMCTVGMAHQVGWILLSPEPLFTHGRAGWVRERVDLMNTAKVLAKIAPADLGNLTDVAALLRNGQLPDTHDGKRPWEKYRASLLCTTGEHFLAIWPRDERMQARLGTALIGQGSVSFERTNYTHAAKSY